MGASVNWWLSCSFSTLKVHTPLFYVIFGFWGPFADLDIWVDEDGKLRGATFRLNAAVHWEHNHHRSYNRFFSVEPWRKWTRASYDSNTSSGTSGNTEAEQQSMWESFPPVHPETEAYTGCTHQSARLHCIWKWVIIPFFSLSLYRLLNHTDSLS